MGDLEQLQSAESDLLAALECSAQAAELLSAGCTRQDEIRQVLQVRQGGRGADGLVEGAPAGLLGHRGGGPARGGGGVGGWASTIHLLTHHLLPMLQSFTAHATASRDALLALAERHQAGPLPYRQTDCGQRLALLAAQRQVAAAEARLAGSEASA